MKPGRLLWRGLLAFIALVLLYQVWIFLHIAWWVNHNPDSSAFKEDRLEVLQEKNPDAKLRHRWVP
jgi:monofunctional biosynthetic peptidoglycan transglycosylase